MYVNHSQKGVKLSKGLLTMTRVNSITSAQADSPYSVFGSISKGVAGGAVLGYAAKYMLPLTEQEVDKNLKDFTRYNLMQTKQAKGLAIEEIRNIENKTPAQDAFIKMVDANAAKAKDSARFSESGKPSWKFMSLRDSKLGEKDMGELKNLIQQVNEVARKYRKAYIKGQNTAIKELKRPTIAFVLTGAVIGFFAGLAHKVISGQLD